MRISLIYVQWNLNPLGLLNLVYGKRTVIFENIRNERKYFIKNKLIRIQKYCHEIV